MDPTRHDVPREQPDPRPQGASGPESPDHDEDHVPATVPARPSGVWGMTDRERRAELDSFHQHDDQVSAPRIPMLVRLAVALVFLLSAVVAVWLTVMWLP